MPVAGWEGGQSLGSRSSTQFCCSERHAINLHYFGAGLSGKNCICFVIALSTRIIAVQEQNTCAVSIFHSFGHYLYTRNILSTQSLARNDLTTKITSNLASHTHVPIFRQKYSGLQQLLPLQIPQGHHASGSNTHVQTCVRRQTLK